MTYAYDVQWEEHCEYEANARYDYIHEAYAATALDAWEEAYSDYVFNCAEEDVEPKGFSDWKAEVGKARFVAEQAVWDDMPF